jgi:hypothetical protein
MIKQGILASSLMLLLVSANAMAYDAERSLNAMAVKLANARHLSVTISMSYDVVQDSGQKIQFSEVRQVSLVRPNHLRIDSKLSDGEFKGLLYNGKLLTKYNAGHNVYSTVNFPGNIDTAVRYAVSKLGLRIPLARLLVSTLPQEMQKLTTSVELVEINTLRHQPVQHIAARSKNVDYQVWVGRNSLPTRIVLTYRNEPGQPQFQADFSDWDLTPNIPRAVFNIRPPQGAEKIPTLISASKVKQASKTEGGAK